MKKLIIRLAIVVVLLVVIAVIAIGLSLDSIVKRGVETVGPQVTKVDVKLAGVNLSLLSGSGTIKGLVVGNPPGYKSPHAISVGSSSISIKPSSVLSDKVVVRSIRIENPDINYEGDVMTDNLRKILDNVKSGSSGTTTTNAPAPTESGPGKKLQVDEFVITGAKMHLVVNGVVNVNESITLPDIKLPPLGQGPEGITAQELTQKAMDALTEYAVKYAKEKATEIGKEAVKKAADEGLNRATGALTNLLKKK
jgi:hypothetical protein